MRKYIIRFLGLIILASLIGVNAYALYYGISYPIQGDNIGGVQIIDSNTPFPSNAVVKGASDIKNTINGRYLKIVNNQIVPKDISEKNFVDLDIKYKKQENGIWVEMSTEEKYLVDLPAKYKKADGTEMSTEEKQAVDDAEKLAADNAIIQAEIIRQNNKPIMLKTMENIYINFLTGDWTNILRTKGLITEDTTITVENTDSTQNIIYLMQLMSIDNDIYIKYASQFNLFEIAIVTKLGGTMADCKYHE